MAQKKKRNRKERKIKIQRKYKNYSCIVIKQNLSHLNVINIKMLRSTVSPFYIPHAWYFGIDLIWNALKLSVITICCVACYMYSQISVTISFRSFWLGRDNHPLKRSASGTQID